MYKDIKFDLSDVLLTPAETSNIASRSSVVPYLSNGKLPLYNAPMDRVISRENEELFSLLDVNAVQTRGLSPVLSTTIHSYSLGELKSLFQDLQINVYGRYLIDMANGHMSSLLDFVKEFKQTYPDTFLMVGNIANPKTYVALSEAGADAIRIFIGSGNSCTTSVNTAIGYATGSLIVECRQLANTLDKPALIIADGGMRDYSDIIKSLALGADSVMIGGLLNKMIESAGENYLFNTIKVPQKLAKKLFHMGFPIYKSMRGMSTVEVQKDWKKVVLRASEGIVSRNKVTGSLGSWLSDFEEYLSSTMSYCGAKNLDEFIGMVDYTIVTDNVNKRYRK